MGYISNTKEYLLRKWQEYYDIIDCKKFDNNAELLSFLGYLEPTDINNDSKITEAEKKFKEENKAILDNKTTKRKLNDIRLTRLNLCLIDYQEKLAKTIKETQNPVMVLRQITKYTFFVFCISLLCSTLCLIASVIVVSGALMLRKPPYYRRYIIFI